MESTLNPEDFYFNVEGLLVLTQAYHLKRGYCCGNGCLHCPYNYDKVPEPKRNRLLRERQDPHNKTNVISKKWKNEK